MYASDPVALSLPATGPSLDGTTRFAEDPLVRNIGGTPLVPLRSLPPIDGRPFELWGKAEFRNPTGSVKDRAALGIVRRAILEGRLTGDRTLLDASSGNTAIAYAMLGARLGFAVELYLPANVPADRLARLRGYGARLVLTDPVEGTDGAQRAARRRSEEEPDRLFYADQYNNPANPDAHYATRASRCASPSLTGSPNGWLPCSPLCTWCSTRATWPAVASRLPGVIWQRRR